MRSLTKVKVIHFVRSIGNWICPIQSRVPNLKALAQVVLEICSIVCQKIVGVTCFRPRPLLGDFLCARSALPVQMKDRRPVGLPAIGNERHGVQGSTPVSEGCDHYHPLLLPWLSFGPALRYLTQPNASHNWLTLAAALGEDSRRQNLSLAGIMVSSGSQPTMTGAMLKSTASYGGVRLVYVLWHWYEREWSEARQTGRLI